MAGSGKMTTGSSPALLQGGKKKDSKDSPKIVMQCAECNAKVPASLMTQHMQAHAKSNNAY